MWRASVVCNGKHLAFASAVILHFVSDFSRTVQHGIRRTSGGGALCLVDGSFSDTSCTAAVYTAVEKKSCSNEVGSEKKQKKNSPIMSSFIIPLIGLSLSPGPPEHTHHARLLEENQVQRRRWDSSGREAHHQVPAPNRQASHRCLRTQTDQRKCPVQVGSVRTQQQEEEPQHGNQLQQQQQQQNRPTMTVVTTTSQNRKENGEGKCVFCRERASERAAKLGSRGKNLGTRPGAELVNARVIATPEKAFV